MMSIAHSEMGRLTSSTIKTLRFPLAVFVVYLHTYPISPDADLSAIDWASFSASDFYDVLRVTISRVLTCCAVPIFFFISGWLFFQKLEEWDTEVWQRKMNNRVRTLLIPYFAWVTLSIIQTFLLKVGGVVLKGRPASSIIDWLNEEGWLRMYWDSLSSDTACATQFTAPHLFPFWFVRDLIFAVALTPVVWWLMKKSRGWLTALLTLAYFAGLPLSWHGIGINYWFCVGAWLALSGKDMVAFVRRYRYVGLTGFVLLLVPSVLCEGFETPRGVILYPFMASSMLVVVVSLFSAAVERGRCRWMASLSNTSFFIFAFHIFILGYVCKAFNLFADRVGSAWAYVGIYLAAPLVTVAISVLLCRMLQRYTPRIAGVLGVRG